MDKGAKKITIAIKKKPLITKKTSPITTPKNPPFEWPRLVDLTTDHDVIISYDVGIINLAYCIMRLDGTEPVIYDWGIIRLADGDPKKICTRKLRSGSACDKKAYYVDSAGKGVCKVHCAKDEKNLERNVTVDNITEWELKTMLFRALDSNPKYLNVNTILIESQPLHAREKIKGIGHSLFDYYVLRGSVDTGHQYDGLQFIDAKNKLSLYDGPPISCHLKTQYARNKWYSVKYCQWFLRHQPDLLSVLNKAKKQDDLADCFMQGLWFLKQRSGQMPTSPAVQSNQKLVYRENNRLKYKKVRAHAPNKKAISSGRYTLSNIKWLISKGRDVTELKPSIEFYFGDLDYFSGVLKNT